MKHTLLSLFALFVFAASPKAQPVITQCENFTIGTVLQFQECNTLGVSAGAGGSSVTWNFTGLSLKPDTSTEWMVAPSTTPYASVFPTANLVERYSNGTFVYLIKAADTNYMVGYADSVNVDTITYPNNMIFAARPLTYGNIVTDSFTNIFTASSYTFIGKGLCTITADGYGTLQLPTRTYSNTLRLRIAQVQTDSAGGGPSTVATTVSYVWFDSSHSSALLKIDSTNSGGFTSKSVEYLISQTPSAVVTVPLPREINLYPNPATDELMFASSGIADNYTYTITDLAGHTLLRGKAKNTQHINIHSLSPGMYLFHISVEGGTRTIKFVKE